MGRVQKLTDCAIGQARRVTIRTVVFEGHPREATS